MRRTRSRRLITLAVALALASGAALLTPAAGAQEDHGPEHETLEPYERAGVGFSSSPAEGDTGTVIEVSGDGCLLRGTSVPGEGVVVQFKQSGRVLAYATVAVRRDGTWSGSIQVPVDAPVRTSWLYARCVYPVHPDPVVYQARSFTVTGTGSGVEATPRTPNFNGGIEAYGDYDGQSTCSPNTKPGMAAFMNMVRRNYGGGSLGVGRGCGAGGTSEHKEGRAWDWAMNAGSAGDRARVQALFNWLFATDSRCRHFARARRLGMMYIIWNRRMFRMYDVDRGWAPYNGASPHTDHVHFSLTRDGGGGRVSFWNPVFQPPAGWQPTRRQVRDVNLGNARSTVRPIAGDFDGDERHDLLWYDQQAGGGFIGFSRPNGTFVTRNITVGPGRVPLVGDFNGDCVDDIIWYGPGAMPDRKWIGRPNRRFRIVAQDMPGTYAHHAVGDFNGDRVSDIVWYNPGPGPDALWHGSAYGFVRRSITMGGNHRPFAGDFDGDHRDDLFWYGPGPVADRLWYGKGRGWRKTNINMGLNADPLVGDFNGDDRWDVIWYRPGQAEHRMWTGRRDRRFRPYSVPMDRPYALPAVGDFDGDLQDDIFWHASPNHPNRLWSY